MGDIYEDNSKIIKALADPNRLKILDILSCGEKCACDVLSHFDFSQPTLSHHMKVLMDCGLVECRKDGVWSNYSINNKNCNKLILFLMKLTTDKDECICFNITENECI